MEDNKKNNTMNYDTNEKNKDKDIDKEQIHFTVKIKESDLMNFKVYHNYHSVSGIAALLFGIIALFICIISVGKVNISYTLMMGFFGLFFTIYTPVGMKLKAKQQVKVVKAFEKPLEYIVSADKIILKQDDIEEELSWDDIYKIKFTGKSLILYITSVRGNVLPLRDIKGQACDFIALARTKLKPFQVKVNDSKLKKAITDN